VAPPLSPRSHDSTTTRRQAPGTTAAAAAATHQSNARRYLSNDEQSPHRQIDAGTHTLSLSGRSPPSSSTSSPPPHTDFRFLPLFFCPPPLGFPPPTSAGGKKDRNRTTSKLEFVGASVTQRKKKSHPGPNATGTPTHTSSSSLRRLHAYESQSPRRHGTWLDLLTGAGSLTQRTHAPRARRHLERFARTHATAFIRRSSNNARTHTDARHPPFLADRPNSHNRAHAHQHATRTHTDARIPGVSRRDKARRVDARARASQRATYPTTTVTTTTKPKWPPTPRRRLSPSRPDAHRHHDPPDDAKRHPLPP
jgi:hypothetical protein